MQPTSLHQTTALSTLTRILIANGLSDATIHQPQSGYRNTSYRLGLADGTSTNLILYKAEPGILRLIRSANRLSDFAATTGLPTRQTRGRILRLTSRTPANSSHSTSGASRIRYACLYNYLPGDTIPWDAYTQDHIKLLGLSLSHLHAVLAQANAPQPHASAVGESQALLGRMQRYFVYPGVQTALAAKLDLTLAPTALKQARAALELAANQPGHQPLHLDFVRSNLLFGPAATYPDTPLQHNNLALTGILDFEKTATGPRIFDIARTLAFLLVDAKTKTPAQIYKYFLHSGYNKRGAIKFTPPAATFNGTAIDVLQALINFYLLHDLYKFLRHNPYEYLSQNAHFLRTRNLLITRKILTTIN
jgi:Ser/Thr protein kinase RdoA (MazF antagonist)